MRSNTKILIQVRGPSFLSQGDENAMFAWLGKINCISKVSGVGADICLEIKVNQVDEECMRELLAIFNRYKMKLFILRPIAEKKRYKWLKNKTAYWYKGLWESFAYKQQAATRKQ